MQQFCFNLTICQLLQLLNLKSILEYSPLFYKLSGNQNHQSTSFS
ncbi:hypothetical protein pb186bvf_007080 [Paramecium bursaria]